MQTEGFEALSIGAKPVSSHSSNGTVGTVDPDMRTYAVHALAQMRNRREELFALTGLAVPNGHSAGMGRFLLDVGAVLHLKDLEDRGFAVGESGEPPAWERALIELALHCNGAAAALLLEKFGTLTARVLAHLIGNFAWTGPSGIGCEVALDGELDDIRIRRLAEFLWANRHTAVPSRGILHG